jgi:hypothetical protein
VDNGDSSVNLEKSEGLKEQTLDYLQRAAAPWMNRNGHKRHEFLLVPASNAGKSLSEAVTVLFPGLKMVRVPGQSDLMFLCEQGNLTFTELATLLKPCRAAYEAAAPSQLSSPHARFDVTDWLPLEP